MENAQRSRIHRMNSRVGSSPKSALSQEDQLGKLQPTIPPSLSQRMATKKDPTLQPISTNSQKKRNKPLQTHSKNLLPIAQVVKKVDPVRPTKQQHLKSEYQLVEDANVPLKIKDIQHRRIFLKCEQLGHGSFARVYRVRDLTTKGFYAAKVISKSSLQPEKIKAKLLAEINIHRVLKHDYIVKFHTCFEDNENVYLILDLCVNKTLNMMIKTRKFLTEDETRYYMGQILSALRYMSDNRVLHRDLKLSNILLDSQMDCKLGDFGLAALLVNSKDRKNTICGTPHYIAPEILTKRGHNHKADMWSAGILMFNLLFGRHPFHHDEQMKLYQQVQRNESDTQYRFPPAKDFNVSEDAKDLISKLLVNSPEERLSVIDALEHPFFSKHDMPDCIPHRALYTEPTHRELFESQYTNSQITSSVIKAVEAAKSRTDSFIDRNINPPLELMNEVVLDPRSQYPIEMRLPQPMKSLIIPVDPPKTEETNSKKRSNTAQEHASKRICSDTNTTETAPVQKENEPSPAQQPKIEPLKVKPSSLDSRPFATPLPLPNRKPVMEEMADNLKIMMERSAAIPENRRSTNVQEIPDFEWHAGNVYVQNWVDGSSHYGFSYRLSDGTLGLLFNDGTTLTTKDQKKYSFIYRDENDVCINKTYDNNVPPELQKKCTVLGKFIQYISESQPIHVVSHQTAELSTTHIFKYLISEDGIVFRLNNGVVQFNLFKRVKLVLYDKGRKLIFIDMKKNLHHYNSMDIFNSNETEIIEILHAVYDILGKQNKARQEALRKLRWTRIEQSYKSTPTSH